MTQPAVSSSGSRISRREESGGQREQFQVFEAIDYQIERDSLFDL